MPIEIINKVNSIVNSLDNSLVITRMKVLKKEIDNNKETRKLIKDFKVEKDIYYQTELINEKLIEVKTYLYNHPLIKEYHSLEQELSYFILYCNEKLTSLISNKKCQKLTRDRI